MSHSGPFRSVLIFGGAGFIGANWAHYLLRNTDAQVHVFDNLSRQGVAHNLADLRKAAQGTGRLKITLGDVRERAAVSRAVASATDIFNFAAQVAVTTSIDDPRLDFDVNLGGTFNILEAARESGNRPFLLFTSTNKVYGDMGDVPLSSTRLRHQYAEMRGISEERPVDFHSPYGCSKGAADQYVHDYARIYNLPTVVFRMSCIAGPRQFGNEDQGWVAHFLYSVLSGTPITVYGNGCQVRDVLHVHDLIDAMMAARNAVERTRGNVFNVGGGLSRAVSVLELLQEIERRVGKPPRCRFREVRPGDQPLYISDTSKLQTLTGWAPARSLGATLDAIHVFWQHNHDAIMSLIAKPSAAEPLEMEAA